MDGKDYFHCNGEFYILLISSFVLNFYAIVLHFDNYKMASDFTYILYKLPNLFLNTSHFVYPV